MEQARGFFKKILELIKKPELRILPGQLAFFLVLSIIPLIALIGTIASLFSIPINTVRTTLSGTVPEAVVEIIANIISGRVVTYSFNMFVFFAIAFVLASNGTHSMIITSNEIYKVKSDSIVKRRIKAILMALVLVFLFLLLLLVPIFGDTIFEIIREITANNSLVDLIYKVYIFLQYPLVITILYFSIKMIYIIAPDEKIETTTTTKGAIFTAIGWILASEIYSFYISTFSNYSLFYGSISNAVILLLWVYILSYIFVLGMIINAGSYNDMKEQEIREQKRIDKNTKTGK